MASFFMDLRHKEQHLGQSSMISFNLVRFLCRFPRGEIFLKRGGGGGIRAVGQVLSSGNDTPTMFGVWVVKRRDDTKCSGRHVIETNLFKKYRHKLKPNAKFHVTILYLSRGQTAIRC